MYVWGNPSRPAGALERELGEESSSVDGSETLCTKFYTYVEWTGVAGNVPTCTITE